MSVDIPLLLFAKAPIPGQVKTRLQSHCTANQAADIARVLTEAAIQKTVAHWPGQVYLSVWLDAQHAFFQQMAAQYAIKIVTQVAGDLGVKMQSALDQFGYPAAVMGCDAPHVSADTLRRAYSLLRQNHSVIGPSEDGGYYLLGLSRPANELFENQRWGSDSVLHDTLVAADKVNCKLELLDSLNDVDEWQDLEEVANQLPELTNYLNQKGLV